jgi:hypothetical protein
VFRALVVAAVVLAATANGGVAAETYPVFYATVVGDHDHRLAHVSPMTFEFSNFGLEAAPESIVVTAPPGYTFAGHVDPNDFIALTAKPVGGGPEQRTFATLGAPTAVSMCVPGEHDLTWDAQADGLNIPFAIDRTAASTRVIVCLDALQAAGLRVTEIAFGANFRTPAKAGAYRFSALVAPSTEPAYELRAYTVLPMRLTTKATYSTETQTLTVSGKLLGWNKPLANRAVWVSTSDRAPGALGIVVTRSDGTFVATTKTTQPPPDVETWVANVALVGCHGTSSAPGGCKTETLDSIENNGVEVTRRGRVRA